MPQGSIFIFSEPGGHNNLTKHKSSDKEKKQQHRHGLTWRKIILIESNAKCRYLKKLACKGTLMQVFYLSEAPSPPITPYSVPLTHCVRVYSILIHTGSGGGGGRTKQREG
jgi:hypothetical protein